MLLPFKRKFQWGWHLKATAFARSLALAKLAAQVGLKEFSSGDMKSRVEQALLITNSLSSLKGAAMKAGQILSLDLNHYFPPEAVQILIQLQSSATAHTLEQMQSVLKKELELSKRAKLTNFSERPIGVASIGQVHRASYKGRDIVLKIQYPEVSDSIDSDLKILKTIAFSFCQLSGRKMNLEPLFNEFRTILNQEVDYQQEADLQKKYQMCTLNLKTSKRINYRVPTIIDELSTRNVLAMSFESGLGIRDWLGTNPSNKKRTDLAHGILDLYFHEFFQWGLVQTDPNWGNFLIDDSSDKLNLVLLDFGATRKFSKEFIESYILLLDLAADGSSEALKNHAVKFGLIDSRESTSAFKAFEEMISTAIRPFFAKKTNSGKFDFSNKNYSIDSQNAAKSLAEELIFSPPPYELIFLHRKLAGVYSILKGLDVQLDISEYWQQMKDLSMKKAL